MKMDTLMNPQVFGKEHLIYVAVSLLVAFAVCFFANRYAKTEKEKTFVIKLSAAVLFLIIFTNRLRSRAVLLPPSTPTLSVKTLPLCIPRPF